MALSDNEEGRKCSHGGHGVAGRQLLGPLLGQLHFSAEPFAVPEAVQLIKAGSRCLDSSNLSKPPKLCLATRLWRVRPIIPCPTGRFLFRHAFPGTACQATIGISHGTWLAAISQQTLSRSWWQTFRTRKTCTEAVVSAGE